MDSPTDREDIEMNRQNIQSIYPLLPTQESFLWTQNGSGEMTGSLQVRCRLCGVLDQQAFQQAWDATLQRHESLRASIHTRNDKSPMLVVWRQLSMLVECLDLSDKSETEQNALLDKFLDAERQLELPLDQAPVSRVHLFKLGPTDHELIWTLHHALLDGWSTSLTIRDLLTAYNEISGAGCRRHALPSSYQDYMAWRTTQQDLNVESFWRAQLEGFQGNPILPSNGSANWRTPAKSVHRQLDTGAVAGLNEFSRSQQLTASAIVAGMWALTLSEIHRQDDIAFGVVVSGRAAPLDGIQDLVGLFANVIPLRVQTQNNLSMIQWLQLIRDAQFEIQPYERTSLADIESWFRLDRQRSLIQTLVVVENYPIDRQSTGLWLRDFESGIATGFPVTICVLPGEDWTMRCVFHADSIEDSQAEAILRRFALALSNLTDSPGFSVGQFRDRLEPPDWSCVVSTASSSHVDRVVKPRNDTEVQLTTLWEQVLGKGPIGIRDNFFVLGGKSLNAMRLLARIEDEFGRRYPPTLLLENPTIEELAVVIAKGDQRSDMMVRFNRKVDTDPIVCVQVGGGHALYYRSLASHLSAHPVVGLQPRGLQGGRPISNFSDLASAYIRELDTAFGSARVHLVGYCMGAAVALEMARQLECAGRTVGSLVIIDSGVKYGRPGFGDFIAAAENKWFGAGVANYLRAKWRGVLGHGKWAVAALRLGWLGNAEQRREYFRRRVERSCQKAFFANQPKPVCVPIKLIRSTQYAAMPSKHFHMEWKELTLGGFSYDVIEADHMNMLLEPDVQKVAAVVARSIEQSQSRCDVDADNATAIQ